MTTQPTSPRRAHPAFLGVLVACLLLPAYVGFRLPNYWSATLTLINAPDGFFRRTFVGTIFKPVWSAFDYAYPAFAILALLTLLALLACIVLTASRACTDGQRLVALLRILAPTGAYCFHIVGYLDLVLYLFLFLAIWLAYRHHLVWASAVLAISALVHENLLLTTLPIFAYRVLASQGVRKAVLASLAPLFAALLVLFLPKVPGGQREIALAKRDAVVAFPMHYDAINVFARSLTDARQLYSVWDVTMSVMPSPSPSAGSC